ncbi:MAG: hypothetical protein ACREU1_15015 [Burkholderiales bacterium]
MRFLLPFVAALLAGACATNEPIHDVSDAPIIAPAGASLSMGEVRAAIERAGRSLGWQLLAERPGMFSGRLALRSHVAVVEIEHDAKSYSIRYRDSINLDAAGGQIHRAYNQWIEKLDRAIRAELERPRQL